MFISWSNDDNSESEPDDEDVKHVTALTGRYESDEDSCDEEVEGEERSKMQRNLKFSPLVIPTNGHDQ